MICHLLEDENSLFPWMGKDGGGGGAGGGGGGGGG